MIKLLQEVRESCDKLLNETKRLHDDTVANMLTSRGAKVPRGPIHEAIYNGYITARLAKAWTDKLSGEVNNRPTPYNVVNDPATIPAEDSKVDGFIYCGECTSKNYEQVLGGLNSLRDYCNGVIIKLESINTNNDKQYQMLTEVWRELHVYRFHLGFALGALRNLSNTK